MGDDASMIIMMMKRKKKKKRKSDENEQQYKHQFNTKDTIDIVLELSLKTAVMIMKFQISRALDGYHRDKR